MHGVRKDLQQLTENVKRLYFVQEEEDEQSRDDVGITANDEQRDRGGDDSGEGE